jgi:hypothetical protein
MVLKCFAPYGLVSNEVILAGFFWKVGVKNSIQIYQAYMDFSFTNKVEICSKHIIHFLSTSYGYSFYLEEGQKKTDYVTSPFV